MTAEQKKLIKDDEVNKKVWDEALLSLKDGPVWIEFIIFQASIACI